MEWFAFAFWGSFWLCEPAVHGLWPLGREKNLISEKAAEAQYVSLNWSKDFVAGDFILRIKGGGSAYDTCSLCLSR
jgi:hypothetical protein